MARNVGPSTVWLPFLWSLGTCSFAINTTSNQVSLYITTLSQTSSSLYTNPQQADLSTKHAIHFFHSFWRLQLGALLRQTYVFISQTTHRVLQCRIAVGFRWRDPGGVKASLGNLCWNGEVARGSEFVRFRFPAGTTFNRQSDEPLPCFLAEEVVKFWNLRYVNRPDASGVMLGSPTTGGWLYF